MERDRRQAIATFFADGALRVGEATRLSESASHHAHVRRLVAGDEIRLTNGAGTRAAAELLPIQRNELHARVTALESVPRTNAIHLLPPVADRDRMLWLGEKATELAIATWQPVRFRRSASVSPRGEGPAFATKLRARMIGALEQSGGAWLPEVREEIDASAVPVPGGAMGFVLDQRGIRILPELAAATGDTAFVLGPEGGIEPDELQLLAAAGWRSVRLASTTLRFETAAIAAIAIARATTLTEDG